MEVRNLLILYMKTCQPNLFIISALSRRSFMRIIFLCLGWLFVALGVIGAFLPVLPTTPFLLLAVACFARSSPRLESWLMNHKTLGPPLKRWRKNGAISRRSKITAISLMAASYAAFWFGSHPSALLAGGVAILMIAPAIFMLSRPSA
jgi:uncharacterized membrane protein YbaN (DUF454 family)